MGVKAEKRLLAHSLNYGQKGRTGESENMQNQDCTDRSTMATIPPHLATQERIC
jgi:hypothetical protein